MCRCRCMGRLKKKPRSRPAACRICSDASCRHTSRDCSWQDRRPKGTVCYTHNSRLPVTITSQSASDCVPAPRRVSRRPRRGTVDVSTSSRGSRTSLGLRMVSPWRGFPSNRLQLYACVSGYGTPRARPRSSSCGGLGGLPETCVFSVLSGSGRLITFASRVHARSLRCPC